MDEALERLNADFCGKKVAAITITSVGDDKYLAIVMTDGTAIMSSQHEGSKVGAGRSQSPPSDAGAPEKEIEEREFLLTPGHSYEVEYGLGPVRAGRVKVQPEGLCGAWVRIRDLPRGLEMSVVAVLGEKGVSL